MAKLSYKGRVVEVNDTDRLLLDYYRGDGATVIDEPDQLEQLPDGQAFQDDGTEKTFEPGQPVPDASGQVVDTATGEPVEQPQPGPTADPGSA